MGIIHNEDLYSDFLAQQIQGFNLTKVIINQELTGVFNTATLQDMRDILKMYKIYADGAEFATDTSSSDYSPARWHSRQIKQLIDKEARFMFSVMPEFTLNDISGSNDNTRLNPNQKLLKKVLQANRVSGKLVRAAKDCLIGKRIAIAVNFNDESGVTISFIPSLEFVYETDPANVDKITKFIQFYSTVENDEKNQQRIYKKKWELGEDGFCYVTEGIYDGNGVLQEEILTNEKTLFEYIPVSVVVNEGLTGDPFGASDILALEDSESWYSKLSSKDIESTLFPYTTLFRSLSFNAVDPQATKDLSRAPGALWDLQTDPAHPDKTGSIGSLDNSMAYSTALDTTLGRIRSSMYAMLDVPDTSNEALQGIITSGKTMQAIYWGLMTRCNEKMLDWTPAFENMVYTIIEGCKLYSNVYKQYGTEPLVDEYSVTVENNYPIMQDDIEEKSSDMMEVNAKVMSRKSYMKKWRNLTDEEVDIELEQILEEQQMLEQENYPAENIEFEDLDEGIEEEEEFNPEETELFKAIEEIERSLS